MDRQIQKEIQLWLDFSQVDVRLMSPDMKAEITSKLDVLTGGPLHFEKDLIEMEAELLLDLQLEVKKYFNFILRLYRDPDEEFDLPDIHRSIRILDGDKLMPTGDTIEAIIQDTEKGTFNVKPGFLTLRLFDLMFGRSFKIIKTCAACRKLFCYLQKKRKRYCSNACRWRTQKKRYREKKAA